MCSVGTLHLQTQTLRPMGAARSLTADGENQRPREVQNGAVLTEINSLSGRRGRVDVLLIWRSRRHIDEISRRFQERRWHVPAANMD